LSAYCDQGALAPPHTRAVLFDLDGTLLDTAPDMAGALNGLRREEGLEPLPFDGVRPQVSHGALALVRLGFPAVEGAPLEALRQRFIDLYEARLTTQTTVYEGALESLDYLDSKRIPWGVVTNKPRRLTLPLLQHLALRQRASVLVCGDTLPQRKPHPAPLLYAAECLKIRPDQCIYIGDAERDVEAARAAGMAVFVALFGYIPANEEPRSWQANGWLESPQAMRALLLSIHP
jgi:N-acetyl-D-muramate 6-phosphate phosphatase